MDDNYAAGILRMDDSSIDQLVQQGYWTPRQAQEARAMKSADAERAAVNSQPEVQDNSLAGVQQAQQMADHATHEGLKGSGLPVSFPPLSDNQPPAFQEPYATLPATMQAPAPMEVPAPMQAEAGQEVMRHVAQDKARQVAVAQQANEAKQTVNNMEIQDKHDEAKVQADMDNSKFNWGQGIAHAISIMMGAYSQGLSGAKENPAVVAIDKEIKLQSDAKKYSDEQKLKMAELLYKQAQQEIEKRKATVDSMVGLKKLDLAEQEVAIKLQELKDKRAGVSMLGKTRFTQAEAMSLSGKEGEDIRSRLVRLPDGTYAPSLNGEDAKKLRTETLPNISNSLRALGQLDKLTDYFGNNPGKKTLSREQKGMADQAVQELVGAIRLEYFGPGVLTDNEQEIARSIIGNPSKVMSLESANRAKLRNMMEKLKFSRRERLRESGVDLPASKNEQVLQQAQQKYPQVPKADLINALIKSGNWNRSEE